MKKIIFIALIFLSSGFFAQSQSYQYYQWEGFNPGIFCNDSSASTCQILNFEVDTLRNVLWIFGDFEGAGTVNSKFIVGYQNNQFITFPDTFQTYSHSNDYLFYQGNLVGCLAGGVWSYDLNSHQFTTIGLFPTSINDGGLSLAEYNGDLYVGGQFSAIKGPTGGWIPAQGIARWDGTNWNALGIGLSYAGTPVVNVMVVYQNKLFAGGMFTIGADTAWNIAQWDGTNWNNLWNGTGGYGTNNFSNNHWSAEIQDMEIFQNKLYIIGNFDSICGIPAHLAYWDGINWTGTSYPQHALRFKSFLNHLIIFTNDNGLQMSWWENNQMIQMSPGFDNNYVGEMETFKDTLYVAGGFLSSGSTPLFRLARLVYDSTGVGINEIKNGEDKIQVYPNPANETVTITAENITEIVVSNLLGEIVQSSKYKVQSNTATIDISKLPLGIYLLRVQTNNGWRVGKVVKE